MEHEELIWRLRDMGETLMGETLEDKALRKDTVVVIPENDVNLLPGNYMISQISELLIFLADMLE